MKDRAFYILMALAEFRDASVPQIAAISGYSRKTIEIEIAEMARYGLVNWPRFWRIGRITERGKIALAIEVGKRSWRKSHSKAATS